MIAALGRTVHMQAPGWKDTIVVPKGGSSSVAASNQHLDDVSEPGP